MKIYPTLSVETTFQSLGSQWLIIMRGPEAEIELTYNGLFNFCATALNVGSKGRGINLEYCDAQKTVALFWSKPEFMHRFFRVSFQNRHNIELGSVEYADKMLLEFREGMEQFFDFNGDEYQHYYTVGSPNAEKPDHDFRDSVLIDAHKNRVDEKQNEKLLAL